MRPLIPKASRNIYTCLLHLVLVYVQGRAHVQWSSMYVFYASYVCRKLLYLRVHVVP